MTAADEPTPGDDAPSGGDSPGGTSDPAPRDSPGGRDAPRGRDALTVAGPLATVAPGASSGTPVAPVALRPRASVPGAPAITRLRGRAAHPATLRAGQLRVTFERHTTRGWRPAPGTLELPAVQRDDVRLKFALATGRYRVKVVATDGHVQRAIARATFEPKEGQSLFRFRAPDQVDPDDGGLWEGDREIHASQLIHLAAERGRYEQLVSPATAAL